PALRHEPLAAAVAGGDGSGESGGQGRRPGPTQLTEADRELVLHVEEGAITAAVGDPDAGVRESAGSAHVGEPDLLRAGNSDDRPGRRLAEQRDERVQVVGQPDPGTDAVAQA